MVCRGAISCSLMLLCALVLIMPSVLSARTHDRDRPLRIVLLGDSLLAGYRLVPKDSPAVQLEKMLHEMGYTYVSVTSKAKSGLTVEGGFKRLEEVKSANPDIVIYCLGANDMKVQRSPALIQNTIDRTLWDLYDRGNRVLVVVGLQAHPRLPQAYRDQFEAIFPFLARRYDAALHKDLLEGIALVPEYNLADGVHPNPKGVKKMLDTLFDKTLRAVLQKHYNGKMGDIPMESYF